MRKMRYIESLVVSALLLAVWLPAQAQFAGPDVTVLKNSNNTQEVQIGQPGSGKNDECYEWTGNYVHHIKGNDKNKPVVTVMPKDPEEVYILKRTDHCGVQYDRVKVTLVDTISIVSVKPTRCYNDGDSIRPEHFEIVTYPPGYESMATVTPIIAHHVGDDPEWKQAVNFRLEYNNHTSHKSTTVSVISDARPLTISVTPEFLKFEKNLSDAEKVLEKAKKVKDGILTAAKVVGDPIKCDFDWSINNATVPDFGCYCCQGRKITTFSLPQLDISGTLGCEGAFPVPYLSIPYANTGLFLTLGFSGGLSLGPTYIMWRDKCSSIEIPGEYFVEIYGGLRLQALSKDLLSVSAQLSGSARQEFLWKVGKPFKLGDTKLKAAITGEVKLASLATYPFEKVLCEVILND